MLCSSQNFIIYLNPVFDLRIFNTIFAFKNDFDPSSCHLCWVTLVLAKETSSRQHFQLQLQDEPSFAELEAFCALKVRYAHLQAREQLLLPHAIIEPLPSKASRAERSRHISVGRLSDIQEEMESSV